ncbi:MAG: ABC transporter substrate-binding protein [Patescibacteria group bacterium]
MNKKLLAGAIILIAAILVISFVSVHPAKQSEEAVRIGLIAPLTGPFADWGTSIQNGMQLAVQDTHHTFDVNYQDDGCAARNGVSIAQEFFDVENIKLIMGPGCVEVLRPIAPLADSNGALLLSTGLLDDAIFAEHPSVLNFATQISAEAEYMAAYLESKQVKRIATIYGTNDFGVEFSKRLPESLAKRGITVSGTNSSNLDITDFRTIILHLIQSKPDAIFIHQGEKQVGLFAKQLREMGYDVPIYGGYGTEADSVLNAGGSAVEGIEYTYPVNSADEAPEKLAFDKRYAEMFNTTPTATSRFVYDGMMILDKALDACAASDTTCIRDYIRHIGKYSGISGDMYFKEDGSLVRPFGIKKIEGGKFIWVTKDINIF